MSFKKLGTIKWKTKLTQLCVFSCPIHFCYFVFQDKKGALLKNTFCCTNWKANGVWL